ncbi:hypothetical protein D1007_30315 [Hordeum vulgare]|nr:hypothetical protein D1007_30315 [Hordeum vulgare]
MVAFPYYFARIRDRLPEIGAPVRAAVDAASGSRWGTVGGGDGPTGGAGAGPASNSAPMADGRHVGGDRSARFASDGSIKAPIAPRLDLEEAFSHFWSAQPRNPRSRASDSFGWWRGKVGGDPRSFAAVTASPPSMGMEVEASVAIDGGSLVVVLAGPVLLLDGAVAVVETGASSPGSGTTTTTTHLLPMSPPDLTTPRGRMRLRWGKQAVDGGVWVPKSQGSSGSAGEGADRQIPNPLRRNQGPKVNQVTPSNVHDPCLICKSREHVPAFCAQAFCERCGRLGHLAYVCCVFLPWSCVGSMCAFQSRGHGFYYIHDSCSANLMKERSNNIVVSIVEGETSTRQMELDLNDYLATGWRCSAHAIGPGVFVVRFPNPRVVAQICYVGRIVLKTSGAVINVTKWSSTVGSKGVMEVAWVKVSNVPLDKRSERNMAYVASLVGVPLEIDSATLHCPASARVKVGCRNVDDIPSVAQAVLGEHFYVFYFEVDQVLVRHPNRGEFLLSSRKSNEKVKNDDVETRIDEVPRGLWREKMIMCRLGKKEQIQESQESIESDVSLHTSLLIDSMAMEFMEEEKHVSVECFGGDVNKKMISPESDKKSFDDVVRITPQVVYVDAEMGEFDAGKVEYMVESPDTAVEVEVIPIPPLATEENLRFSLRNVQSKMDDI